MVLWCATTELIEIQAFCIVKTGAVIITAPTFLTPQFYSYKMESPLNLVRIVHLFSFILTESRDRCSYREQQNSDTERKVLVHRLPIPQGIFPQGTCKEREVETATTNQCAKLHSSQGKLPKLTLFFSQMLRRRKGPVYLRLGLISATLYFRLFSSRMSVSQRTSTLEIFLFIPAQFIPFPFILTFNTYTFYLFVPRLLF